VSLIDGKPAVEWTFDRETVLSPNFGPDPSDYYWQITAPCLPWPTCFYEPPISFDPNTVPPHTSDVPLPGTLALVVLGAIMLWSTRVRRSHHGGRDSCTA